MSLSLLLVAQLGAPPVLPIPGASPTPMAPVRGTPARPGKGGPAPTYQDYDARPPVAIPAPPRRPIPMDRRPMAGPPATPKPAAKPKPKPRPTPRPAWRPPRGTVYVDRSGLYPAAVRLRYGTPLRFMQAAGKRAPLALVAVDPHVTRTGEPRALTAFPHVLGADAKWTWLGDGRGFAHRHWPIAQGPWLEVQPETFLALHDEIWGPGVGYLWPARFLFYVAAGGTWRRLIVTLDR